MYGELRQVSRPWRAALAMMALCTLTWTASTSPGVIGYAIYTSLVSGEYLQGPAWIGNGLGAICEDLGLTADNLTHYFVVKAFTASDTMSGPSNEVNKLLSATPPPPPPPTVCLKTNPKGKCLKWGTP